jgi:hypothetical protein
MSARMARRGITAASLGKMPTARARRLISLLTRSSALVLQVLDQCARGTGERDHLGLRCVHQRPDLREPGRQLVADLVAGRGDGGGRRSCGTPRRPCQCGLWPRAPADSARMHPAALVRGALEGAAWKERPGRGRQLRRGVLGGSRVGALIPAAPITSLASVSLSCCSTIRTHSRVRSTASPVHNASNNSVAQTQTGPSVGLPQRVLGGTPKISPMAST